MAETDRTERLAINTSTGGIEIGVYPARIVSRMFSEVAALGLVGRYDRDTGGAVPVVVGDVVGAAGNADSNIWGSGFSETNEGSSRARVDPTFGDSVKFESHDAQWQVQCSFEMVRDMAGFEDWLERQAAVNLAQHLLWRVAAGSGAGQGLGVRTALDGNSANQNGAAQDPTPSELRAMRFHGVAAAYRGRPSCAWWCFDTSVDALSALSEGGERLLKFDDTPPGAEGMLYGKPVYAVPGFPAFGTNAKGSLAFGAWECMGLSLVGGMRADKTAHVDFEHDQVRFRFSQSYDCQLVDPAGLVLFNSGS